MSFNCKQCGTCCRWGGWVYLTNNDITAIAGHIKISEHEFIQTYTQLSPNRHQLCLAGPEQEACLFLDNNQCRIYPVRPRQCRTYPHTWRTSTPCPGFPTAKDIEDNVPPGRVDVLSDFPVPLAPKRKKLRSEVGFKYLLIMIHICTPYMEYGQQKI